MTIGSLFAGVGGFDFGLELAGLGPTTWCVEIDGDCRRVLKRHWPNAELFEDVRECGKHNLKPVDLICAGFPCQDLSVAGKRAGLEGSRSGLFYEMVRIIDELRPTYCLLENVPGLYSSESGRDFLRVLVELDAIGYCGAWRCIDAQYAGLAQRRRRWFGVFARGDIGAERPSKILSLESGVQWNIAPSRKKGQGIAADVAGSLGGGSGSRGWNNSLDVSGAFIPEVSPSVTSKWAKGSGGYAGNECQNLVPEQTYLGNAEGGAKEVPFLTCQNLGKGISNQMPLIGTPQAYTIQQNDGGDHKRKDRPNGGMYVKETDVSLTVGSTDQTVVAMRESGQGYWMEDEIAGTIRAEGENRPSRPSQVVAIQQNASGEVRQGEVAYTLNQNSNASGRNTGMVAFGISNQPTPKFGEDISPSLDAKASGGGRMECVAFAQNTRDEVREMEIAGALPAQPGMKQQSYIRNAMAVRRLSPRECERLQGFQFRCSPDYPGAWQDEAGRWWSSDWTDVDADGKVISDSARYRMMGNSVAVPVVRWIGERLKKFMEGLQCSSR